jgi:endonuclease/exonuclease/phosphatase family metal-dependent hydrolase
MAKKPTGFLRGTIDTIAALVTLTVAAALVCAYAAPTVDPNRVWIFAYAGLAAPVLWILNLLLTVYWLARRTALFFLPAVLLLIGLPKVKAFYRFPTKNTVQTTVNQGTISILTCNVEGFLGYDNTSQNRVSTAREITGFIRERNPQIVCIQEFQSTPSVPQSAIDTLLAAWPHRKIHYTIRRDGKGVFGLALYSQFPILSAEGVTFEESRNGAIRAELLRAPGDTLRVICNHLETTYIKDEDLLFLQPDHFADDPDRRGRIRNIAGRLRQGFQKRARQAEQVAGWIAERDDLPTIVCGDFNDPPISYAYHTIRRRYADAFEQAGVGYGYTYKKLNNLLRIDYILHSSEFETLSYDSPDAPWSDHRPVTATLQLKND